ncbi:MAG TPA: hypothetical protein VMC02_02890 [Steroidobacteraceae bacterium]|nr:hypothetical protein [Steroidobacteraceae bacterium]
MKDSDSSSKWPQHCVATLLASLATLAHAQGGAQCPQVPCDDVRTVAAASTGVPVEHDFNAAAATTYYITLTDLGAQFAAPQPLASLKLAITANDALVSLVPITGAGAGAATTTLVVDGAGSVATNGVATASFTTTSAGAYRFHIVGAPANGTGPGPIGLTVSATQGGAPVQSWSDAIGLSGAPPSSAEGIIQQSFTVTAAGAYTVSVADLGLPQSLQGPPQLLLLQAGNVIAILPDPGSHALNTTLTLQPGGYQVFAVGLAANGAAGGLFSASAIPVPAGGGAPAFSWTVPVGGTIAVGGATPLTAGSQYSLSLNDLAFPAALTHLAAMAVDVSVGAAAASLAGSGTQTFTAAGGMGDTYQIYAAAQAATTPGAGGYTARILPMGSSVAVAGAAKAVTASGGTLYAYDFTADVPAAGTYTATLTDLQIPAALGAAKLALVQGGGIVGTPLASPGSITATLSAGSGSLTLLAFASSSAAAGSLLDVSVSDASSKLVFDQPQGVGAAFNPTQVSITTKGTYQFTLQDLAWPASFSAMGGQLTAVLTQGGTLVGEFFGGGTLSSIPVTTTGKYYLSIIATPTGSDQAGTYALNISPAPPAPSVNLSADAASVAAGGTVHLLWTTTGATSCVASGGGWSGTFTGAQATSDSVTSPAISTATTFKLTCTGAGGTAAGSVTISIAPAKGGGGAIGEGLLLVLGGCLTYRRRRRD